MLCVFKHNEKNEVLIHVTTWMNIPSERSHTEKSSLIILIEWTLNPSRLWNWGKVSVMVPEKENWISFSLVTKATGDALDGSVNRPPSVKERCAGPIEAPQCIFVQQCWSLELGPLKFLLSFSKIHHSTGWDSRKLATTLMFMEIGTGSISFSPRGWRNFVQLRKWV